MGLLDFINGKKNEAAEIAPVLPKDIYAKGTLDLADLIAPAALKVNAKDIELGDKVARTFYTISYPPVLSDGWLSPIVNLDQMFDLSIFTHPLESAAMLRQFEKRVAEVQSQIMERESKGLVRDPMLDTSYQNLEELRDELQQAREKLFEVGLYLTLYADSKEELEKLEGSAIHGQLDGMMVYTKPALFQQEQGFRSTLPLCLDELGVHVKQKTSPLSSYFPFISFDLTSDHGILFGLNRQNASLILFDRFSLENYNSVVFAKSGSGKSYAMKLEILRSLMFDTEVIVIDPEREYEQLAEATGGRSFNISLSSEHHLNPFDLPPVREGEDPSTILRENVVNLVGLFRTMLGGLTQAEDALVDRAITETYALKDITGERDFTGVEPPLLSDFESVLSGMEGSESLVERLSKYTRGSWAGFLNQPTNIDINKQFIVFSVRDMEDELKPVAMRMVTHYIWNAVRRDLKKRLLVVDEAWWMMQSEDTASFLLTLVKRGRKYYLGVATVTQDVEDFMSTKYGASIIKNSSLQLLLRQSPTAIDALQDVFKLTDEEKYVLLEAGVGQGLFFAGSKHVAIRIVASKTEDSFITSDPSQLLRIREEKNRFNAEKDQS
jgi:conjugal transfer ATP-binding protein TraC